MPVKIFSILTVCVVFFLAACSSKSSPVAMTASPYVRPGPPLDAPVWTPGPNWTLSWDDRFTGPNPLQNWTPQAGGFNSGSRELQYFSPENVKVNPGGGLSIIATTNGYGQQCWYGPCRYSSAMLKTRGQFEQQYGVFSAYIKLPAGRGLWPAFWVAGVDTASTSWPYGGEIDIIEVNNRKPGLVESFVHSPSINRGFYLQLKKPLSAGYHEYSMVWAPTGITLLIDGQQYGYIRLTPGAAPFNQPFFMILDLAVGGTWPGPPNAQTVFPAQMDVAWVRVYKQKK